MSGWLTFVVLGSMPAFAQDDRGFDAHGFHVAPLEADARAGLMVPHAAAHEAGDWYLGGVLEYADAPLIGTAPNGDEVAIVDNLVALNTGLGVSAHERLRLELSAPLFLAVTGRDGPEGVAVGDLRLGATGTLLDARDGLGLALRPWIDLPTGPHERFLGQGSVAGGVAGVVTVEADALSVSADFGAQLNPKLQRANLTGSDALLIGVGANYLASADVGVGVEVRGQAPLTAAGEAGTGAPWEGLVYGRLMQGGGGHALAGLSTGLSTGVGAAAFRVFVGGGFGSSSPDGAVVRQPVENEVSTETVRLRVLATFRGTEVEGATVTLDGPEAQSVETPAEIEVAAQSLWKGNARLGGCLEGDGLVQVHDGDTELEIPLQYLPGATLRLVVMDPNGKALTDADVQFHSRDSGCAPPDSVAIGADGSASLEIGRGPHRMTITAEGFQTFEASFTLEDGDAHEVIALLAPE